MFPCICKHYPFAKEHGLRVHWGTHHAHLPESQRQRVLQRAREIHAAWMRRKQTSQVEVSLRRDH